MLSLYYPFKTQLSLQAALTKGLQSPPMEWSVHPCGCVSLQISHSQIHVPLWAVPHTQESMSLLLAAPAPSPFMFRASFHAMGWNQPKVGCTLEPENGKLAAAIIPQVPKSSASICGARQSWDDSGRAVQLESSPSCLSSSSEQNKHFKQGLLCLFPGSFTNGKAIYAFPPPNTQIIAQGFWLQRLLGAAVSFSLRFPRSNPWLILCPRHQELPGALSCPSWATQHTLEDESDSKINCVCLWGHVQVRGGFSHEVPALQFPGFRSGHSERFFYRVTRRKNLSHQQAKSCKSHVSVSQAGGTVPLIVSD